MRGGQCGGARRAPVTAVAVGLLVALLLAACSLVTPSRTQSATPGGATTSSATPQAGAPDPTVGREEALSALLTARASAVRERDRVGFAATLDAPRSGFGLRQLAQFDALAQLPLAEFAYGTPEPAPALGADRVARLGPDAWVSRVAGRYRLEGFDTASRSFETYFTVVRRGDRWRLADDADGGTQPQLWDLPRFTVVQSRTTLVAGTGPAKRLEPYLALGDRAVGGVAQVWTAPWNRRLVLVVPASAEAMAAQVGQQAGQVAQVAAVTDGPLDTTGRGGADRVVVNPAAFATLEVRGQQVVVTHEATHVAIRATTTRPVPLWLSEGMADFVGYRGSGATRPRIAAALLDRVRAGKGPKALPGAADFDPARATIAPSYNAAWLAVTRIADRHGVAALVRFYLAAATGPQPPDPASDAEANTRAAFASVLGTTETAFTRDWLAYLRRLAD